MSMSLPAGPLPSDAHRPDRAGRRSAARCAAIRTSAARRRRRPPRPSPGTAGSIRRASAIRRAARSSISIASSSRSSRWRSGGATRSRNSSIRGSPPSLHIASNRSHSATTRESPAASNEEVSSASSPSIERAPRPVFRGRPTGPQPSPTGGTIERPMISHRAGGCRSPTPATGDDRRIGTGGRIEGPRKMGGLRGIGPAGPIDRTRKTRRSRKRTGTSGPSVGPFRVYRGQEIETPRWTPPETYWRSAVLL